MVKPNRTNYSPGEYLTPREAAQLARISTRTLTRLAERGQVDSYALPSGHRRYRRESIEQLTAAA